MNGRVAVIDAKAHARAGLLRRRKNNRRVAVQRRTFFVWLADGFSAFWRVTWAILRPICKLTLFLASVVGAGYGARWAVRHVVASPRFAVQTVAISPTARASRQELEILAGVQPGDHLLSVDTDDVAARVASHPWVAAVRVERQLPSELRIEVTERQAAALANLGGLYLLDLNGQPFKRATMAEAEGLPAISGIDRARYLELRDASEAAFREALALLTTYALESTRPAISEIVIDPSNGFTLFLLDGGAEIRLGRGDCSKKLARFDQILEALKAKGATARSLRTVHLDGGSRDRVAARFDEAGT